MGDFTAGQLVARARRILQDVSNVSQRWADSDLFDGLSEGQRVLVSLKPDACTETAVVALVDSSYQLLPSTAISLLRVIRNMGVGGTTPGRAITLTSMHDMDDYEPDWHNARATEVLHYMVDEEDNDGFYVYPAMTTGYVEIRYAKVPAPVTATGDTISVPDIYDAALVQYICYAALSSDMDAAANQALAKDFFNQFITLVTGKLQAEDAVNPNGRP